MKPQNETLEPASCCGGERTLTTAVGAGLPAGTTTTKCNHKDGCKANAPVPAESTTRKVGTK